MSLNVQYSCDECGFCFLGGHTISSDNVEILDFHAVCKKCLNSLVIYSEDLGYLQANKLCFLLKQVLPIQNSVFDKTEQRDWKRRISRATGSEKAQIKIERDSSERIKAQNILENKVKSGIPIRISEKEGIISLELSEILCPQCHFPGEIILGFTENEICPKCRQGRMICSI